MKRRRRLIRFVLLVLLLLAAGCLWLRTAKRQYALNRHLIAAMMHGDTRQALVLVNEGADPNTCFNPPPSLKPLLQQFLYHKPLTLRESPTAFMFACGMTWDVLEDGCSLSLSVRDDLPLVRAMLLHGADVNKRMADGESVLLDAAYNRHVDTLELLLGHGAEVNASSSNGLTALMGAAHMGYEAKVGVLLAYGAKVNAQNKWGRTALHFALETRMNKNTVKQLLVYGANPNQADKDRRTPLMLAQQMNRPDILTLLRKGGK